MTTQENSIYTDLETDKITILTDLDLNSLFNLSYNFDLLKGIITTLLKNQQNLQKQCEAENRTNNDQYQLISNIQNDLGNINDNYVNKESYNELLEEIKEINGKLKTQEEYIQQSK